MSWGIAETASEIEKIKAESADYLNGLNSCGEIEYSIYSNTFDFYAELIDKAYKQGVQDERRRYDDAVKTIADASFTGGDGLDYVETLVALNAIRGMKRETGEWKPYTYVASDDWYQDKETRYRCSKCGVDVIDKSNFCPHCGAKMTRETKT